MSDIIYFVGVFAGAFLVATIALCARDAKDNTEEILKLLKKGEPEDEA